MKQSALTTLVTEQGHDTTTGVAIIVLALVGLAFWAGSEFVLHRELDDARNQERLDEDRDAIARATGLIDQRRSAAYAEEFADAVENRLTVFNGGKAHRPTLRDELGAGDAAFLIGAAILAAFWVAVLAVTR